MWMILGGGEVDVGKGGGGSAPGYKHVCNKQVSYQSSRVLAILWISGVLQSDEALDDESLVRYLNADPTYVHRVST